jgi:hypothetical protein
MSFGKLKTHLRGIINRKDLTDALAGDFINLGIKEIERVCRVGSMEALLELSDWDGVRNSLTIPAQYLETIDIFTADGTLRLVSKDDFFAQCPTGRPEVFIKTGKSWMIKPYPAPGTTVFLHYYAETLPLLTDTDENVWSQAGFSAVVYAAAALAANYFQMEDQYVLSFQSKSDSLVEAILSQDLSEKWSGKTNMGRVSGRGEY